MRPPAPDIKPPADTSGIEPYVTFWTESQWQSWVGKNCAGRILIDTSTTWENGLGAAVRGELYYGYGIAHDSLDWLNITPIGSYQAPEPAMKWPQRAIAARYESDADVFVSGSIGHWRGFFIMPELGYNWRDEEMKGAVQLLKVW